MRDLEVEIAASNIELLGRLRERIRLLPRAVAESWASRVEELLRMHAPVRAGRLRRELTVEAGADGLTVTGPYYLYHLILGTRPHEIRPHRAKVLRFEVEGRIAYAKRVWHPGFPPQPFFREALTRAFDMLPEIVAEALGDA